MVTRETYLQKLRQLKDQNVIKVITGIRRGKSTLLEAYKNELIENGISSRNIIFLNLKTGKFEFNRLDYSL